MRLTYTKQDIHDRLMNVAVGGFNGEGNAWLHSDQEHIVERWSRPSKNYLIYQITIDDPMILTKPWTSATRRWSLAAPDDEWTEVFCTHKEEPEEWKHIDKDVKDDYEDKYNKWKADGPNASGSQVCARGSQNLPGWGNSAVHERSSRENESINIFLACRHSGGLLAVIRTSRKRGVRREQGCRSKGRNGDEIRVG